VPSGSKPILFQYLYFDRLGGERRRDLEEKKTIYALGSRSKPPLSQTAYPTAAARVVANVPPLIPLNRK